MVDRADVVVVGAGAAGLMAGIWAARTAPDMRVVVLDGARKLGAKILVAGGGRCNVTHEVVRAEDFNGSSRPAIRNVLARFDVERTVAFFEEIGVVLKREETGKLFPVTDDAKTVLRALVQEGTRRRIELRHPRRVRAVARGEGFFELRGEWGRTQASRLILATGGKSLPRTGSDGGGYALARSLGHTLTPEVVPALVPLLLPKAHRLLAVAGSSATVELTVRAASHKALASCGGPLLCTHFGLSGPAVLDVSRHWRLAHDHDPGVLLTCDWIPSRTSGDLDAELRAPGPGTVVGRVRRHLTDRLARTLSEESGVAPDTQASRLARADRKRLVATLKTMVLPITGDRGWSHAEVTAGGIPLAEIEPATMASRVCAGLHLCGEVCDVDGRIGGFNFQWAWASGHVAGVAAALSAPAYLGVP